MLADNLQYTEMQQVLGLHFAVGLDGGYAYTQRSDTHGATKAETQVRIVDRFVSYETPALTVAHGGEWFVALVEEDKVKLFRSRQHCREASWQPYQTLE